MCEGGGVTSSGHSGRHLEGVACHLNLQLALLQAVVCAVMAVRFVRGGGCAAAGNGGNRGVGTDVAARKGCRDVVVGGRWARRSWCEFRAVWTRAIAAAAGAAGDNADSFDRR
jgi:hypothetical protein